MGNSAIERNGENAVEPNRPPAGVEVVRGDEQPKTEETVQPPKGRVDRLWLWLAEWPNRLNRWIVEQIRTWLGINAQEKVLGDHGDLMMEMALQSNDLVQMAVTTRMEIHELKEEGEKLKRRLLFYAEHCDSLSFAHRKFQNILEAERLQAKEK